jgi:carboxypeptidase family protein
MCATANAQGSFFGSLSGTVADNSGAVIPGADVKIKNNDTGAEFNAVTGSDGGFTVASMPGGTYTVTVTLQGFKTAVLSKVTVQAAIPASVKVTLQLGAIEENITVVAESASIVQTATPAISTNMTSKQILGLPLSSRNALDSITSLPGFNTAGAARGSTISGLPRGSINITLDGMSVQDNYLKDTDGYFARLSPRLDAVEEVTVTTAGGTAETTSGGSAQIKFVTRSGTNNFTGSVYEYYQNDKFNANSWLNNRDQPIDPATGKAQKAKINLKQTGGRIGGPITIPGLFSGRDKAFFFFNYEQSSNPGASSLNRTVLSPASLAGNMTYNVGGTVRSVNLLALAAANGQTATPDPQVMAVLTAIQKATASGGTFSELGNPMVQKFTWQTPTKSFNPYPTGRVDFNLSQKHRLTGSFNYQHINSTPDTTNNAEPSFPGFTNTGSQQSTRWTTSESLRSTLSPNMVNEFRAGGTGGATYFSPEISKEMFVGQTPELYGLALNVGGVCCSATASERLTNPYNSRTTSAREASTKVMEDTLTVLKGKHTLNTGMNFIQADVWLKNQTMAPLVQFNVVTGDPAEAMFNATNFPGAATQDLTNAKALYALLTGRISSIAADARINEAGDAYTVLGPSRGAGRFREFDFFASDSWRVKPNVTFTYGLRYILQLPFYATNNSLTQVTPEGVWGTSGVGTLFTPGAKGGTRSSYQRYPEGTYAFRTDRNNFAPALGITWSPGGRDGLLGAILGQDGDTVFRGSASTAYERVGMTNFAGGTTSASFTGNQGIQIAANRDLNSGNLGTLPQLLRNPGSTALPVFPSAPTYPIAASVTNNVNAYDPNLQVPYANTWSAGVQRKITRNTAVEFRYVGSNHLQSLTTYNYNEYNIVENNFLNEFRLAQANLQANIAGGRGATFAYTGIPGTAPLPTFLAYFSGVGAANAGDPTRYTAANFTNATYVNTLAKFGPNPFFAASSLQGVAGQRTNAINAGLPANFFLVNPDVNQANLVGNGGFTKANSFQTEFRKRLSSGIAFSTSYTYGKAYQSNRYSFRTPRVSVLQTGTDGNVIHALKGNWVFELPFGRGKHWGGNASGLLNGIIGGWEFDGVARIQSGELLDFGNVRLVGMTKEELQKSIKQRFAADGQVYLLPQDIIDNTIRAFNTSATDPSGYPGGAAPTGRYLAPQNSVDCIETANGTGAPAASAAGLSSGFGACGINNLVIAGSIVHLFDLSFVKQVPLVGHTSAVFRIEALNAFNSPYLVPRAALGTQASSYQLNSQTGYPPRVVQLVFRLNF